MRESTTTKWQADVKKRREALASFAGIIAAPVENGLVWGKGRYLLLHYDLITIDRGDSEISRSAYQGVKLFAMNLSGVYLGETVFALPLPSGDSSILAAVKTWNALGQATKGTLAEGDAFYLHYSDDQLHTLGCIAQVVTAGQKELSKAPLPKVN
ncbi:MAG: hypothetical protein QM783_16065 [Phycisphaerales bacterium]